MENSSNVSFNFGSHNRGTNENVIDLLTELDSGLEDFDLRAELFGFFSGEECNVSSSMFDFDYE